MTTLFCLLLSGTAHFGLAQDSGSEQSGVDSLFSVTGQFLGYCNNLEYFNRYREGILHLGASTNLALSYQPVDELSFSLGVYLRKAFGDEDFMTDIRPVFQAMYSRGGYRLIIGKLLSENQHGMIDAIITEQFDYEQGLEEGLQFLFTDDWLRLDLWAASNLLETREHREHLDVGLNVETDLGKISFSGMTLWDHYGGQQYEIEDDPIRDNITGSVGVDFLQKTALGVDGIGCRIHFLASATTNDRGEDSMRTGQGFFIRPYITFFDFTASFQFYHGRQYTTWRGNPLYQANDPYYYLEMKRNRTFGRDISFDRGVRLDFVEIDPGDYFDHTEHQFWIRLQTAIDHTLF
ncbi:MAG: hypothetical protein ACOCW2_04640 [Chitinivibrionales bacterium]